MALNCWSICVLLRSVSSSPVATPTPARAPIEEAEAREAEDARAERAAAHHGCARWWQCTDDVEGVLAQGVRREGVGEPA